MVKVLRFRKPAYSAKRYLSVLVVALVIAGIAHFSPDTVSASNDHDSMICDSPSITDGDTFRCGDLRIRLAGIDAPEMPGHCRAGRKCTPGDPVKAKKYLQSLINGSVKCRQTDMDHYGRTIARCEAAGVDLSCAMVAAGHAVERYGNLSCP